MNMKYSGRKWQAVWSLSSKWLELINLCSKVIVVLISTPKVNPIYPKIHLTMIMKICFSNSSNTRRMSNCTN